MVNTPMFDPRADEKHLERIEDLVRDWVDFVKESPDHDRDFRSFSVQDRS